MIPENVRNEIAVLRGLLSANDNYNPASQNAIGGLCGLIKEAAEWKKDNRAERMRILRCVTGIDQIQSSHHLTAGTVSVLIEEWKDEEQDKWAPNDRCKLVVAFLSANPEITHISKS